MNRVEWIMLEFLAGYPFGYFKLLYKPDGSIEYICDGKDLPLALPNGSRWLASKRVYQNLAKIILTRPWEQEIDPRLEAGMVCDGWTEKLTWSIKGITEEQSLIIGEGPASLLKVMERIRRLARDEELKMFKGN
jgi:hypothetical protein